MSLKICHHKALLYSTRTSLQLVGSIKSFWKTNRWVFMSLKICHHKALLYSTRTSLQLVGSIKSSLVNYNDSCTWTHQTML